MKTQRRVLQLEQKITEEAKEKNKEKKLELAFEIHKDFEQILGHLIDNVNYNNRCFF